MAVSAAQLQVTVGEYLATAFRRKWWIMGIFSACVFVAVVFAKSLPPIYEASNLIKVVEPTANSPFMKGLTIPESIKERLSEITRRLQSRSQLKSLALHPDIRLAELGDSEEKIEATIINLRKGISVRFLAPTLISISYRSPDRSLAEKVVDTVFAVFQQQNKRLQEKRIDEALTFIEKQVEKYKMLLEESEKRIQDFQEVNQLDLATGIRDLPTEEKKLSQLHSIASGSSLNKDIQQLVLDQTELLDVMMQIEQANKRKEALERQISEESELVVSSLTEEDTEVTKRLKNKLAELKVQLSEKLADCTEEHPMVISLRHEIERIDELLNPPDAKSGIPANVAARTTAPNPVRGSLVRSLREVEVEIESLDVKQNRLASHIEVLEKKIKRLPEKQLEAIRLKRDYSVNASIYAMLKNKLETARITKHLDQDEQDMRFEEIDKAAAGRKAVAPNKKVIALMGVFVGTVLSFGFVIFLEYVDHSLRGIEDAKRHLDLPVLGVISHFDTQPNRQRGGIKRVAVFAVILIVAAGVGIGAFWVAGKIKEAGSPTQFLRAVFGDSKSSAVDRE